MDDNKQGLIRFYMGVVEFGEFGKKIWWTSEAWLITMAPISA